MFVNFIMSFCCHASAPRTAPASALRKHMLASSVGQIAPFLFATSNSISLKLLLNNASSRNPNNTRSLKPAPALPSPSFTIILLSNCDITELERTNGIVFQHTQRSVRARSYEGLVVSGERHGDEAHCYRAGFDWKGS